MKLDLIYILYSSALVMGIALAPFVALGVLMRLGRSFFVGGLIVYASFSALLAGVILTQAAAVKASRLSEPVTNLSSTLRVGPSWYSITHDLFPILCLTVWLSVLILGLVGIAASKLARLNLPNRLTQCAILCGASVAACWTIIVCFFGEYTHEDTHWGRDFTVSKWNQIQPGMSRQHVETLIGPPVMQSVPGFAEQSVLPDMWAYNDSAGYYAAVWFTNDLVMAKNFWFMD